MQRVDKSVSRQTGQHKQKSYIWVAQILLTQPGNNRDGMLRLVGPLVSEALEALEEAKLLAKATSV